MCLFWRRRQSMEYGAEAVDGPAPPATEGGSDVVLVTSKAGHSAAPASGNLKTVDAGRTPEEEIMVGSKSKSCRRKIIFVDEESSGGDSDGVEGVHGPAPALLATEGGSDVVTSKAGHSAAPASGNLRTGHAGRKPEKKKNMEGSKSKSWRPSVFKDEESSGADSDGVEGVHGPKPTLLATEGGSDVVTSKAGHTAAPASGNLLKTVDAGRKPEEKNMEGSKSKCCC